jgi:predicted DNA-binding protein (MmcQ/YjbR family)
MTKHNHIDLEQIRKWCLLQKGTTESVKWENDLVFSIGEKMYCVVALDQTPTSASFKAADDTFDLLVAREGFKPAPYLAKHKWVWLSDVRLLPEKQWLELLKEAYTLVKDKLPKAQQKRLGL